MNRKEEKGVCRCNSCNQSFHQSEIVRTQQKHYGHVMTETNCPHCGGINFSLIDYIDQDSIEGVYKKERFLNDSKKKFQEYISKGNKKVCVLS